ncbi:MAG: glycosyltransferase family 4 protein [Nanoarchaeota archaeon]|jgi:glycogen(starch) synthase|nr:glycosyltransferase family 4 protein [Nanoarchaeota archaeon]
MKVLMFGWEFPPFNSGGLGTACEGLTKALAKQNAEITFVMPKRVDLSLDFMKLSFADDHTASNKIMREYYFNSPLQAYSNEETYEICINTENQTEEKKKTIYGKDIYEEVLRYASVGEQIAGREDFDIIHAHDWLTFKAALAAKKASGKFMVAQIHATEFDRTGNGSVNQRVYEIEKEGLQGADLVITVSNFTKQKVMKHYGIPEEKIRVVHNANDFSEYTIRQLNDLKKNKKVVLFLGRITLQKGPDYFVQAAKKTLEHYPNAIFVVAGSGDMENQMIRQVASLGLADKFIFAGFLRGDDTKRAYQMADLYVMPSVSEPFGLTPLESMINGTPTLISNQSGVSEVVDNCLKTDFWDVDDMTNKIVSVLRYNELYKCLQTNGTEEVKKLTWDKPARRCVDIYEELLEKNKNGGTN